MRKTMCCSTEVLQLALAALGSLCFRPRSKMAASLFANFWSARTKRYNCIITTGRLTLFEELRHQTGSIAKHYIHDGESPQYGWVMMLEVRAYRVQARDPMACTSDNHHPTTTTYHTTTIMY